MHLTQMHGKPRTNHPWHINFCKGPIGIGRKIAISGLTLAIKGNFTKLAQCQSTKRVWSTVKSQNVQKSCFSRWQPILSVTAEHRSWPNSDRFFGRRRWKSKPSFQCLFSWKNIKQSKPKKLFRTLRPKVKTSTLGFNFFLGRQLIDWAGWWDTKMELRWFEARPFNEDDIESWWTAYSSIETNWPKLILMSHNITGNCLTVHTC